MKGLWSWLTKEREFPGPLRYIAILKVRRPVFKLCRQLGLKRIVLILCALVCAVVILHTVLNIWAYLALQGELKKARAAGVELDLRKYEQIGISETENAANLYRAAFALLRSCQGEHTRAIHAMEDYWPEQGVPGPEVMDALRQFLELDRVSLAFSLIEEANNMPLCNWEIRYTDLYKMHLSHLAGLRDCAYALLIRFRLRYLEGDQAGSAEDVGAVVQLAKRIETDNIVVSELVQQAMGKICREAVLQMVQVNPMVTETALRLSHDFEEFDRLVNVTESLHLEAASAYPITEELRRRPDLASQIFGERHTFFFLSYPFRPLFRWQQARMLHHELELVELNREPYYKVSSRLADLDERLASAFNGRSLASAFVAVLPRVVADQAESRASLRTAQLGLVLDAYRARFGSYPDSVEPLVLDILPELPVDPFSGKDLLYRLSEGEVLVYSVGENGVDDDGLTEKQGDGEWINPGTDDIAWRVPRQDLASD